MPPLQNFSAQAKRMKKTKTIKVDYLARVEGEGALYLKYAGDKVEDVRLKIFEPPRFFEALLRGRDYSEAPDITARICGICPVAYQMSAVHAMENALDLSIDPAVRELRRLLYCGEWIESHLLHIYMLHAPDFLGYPDVVHMARDYPQQVERGLQLKKAGNEIVALVGGREVHPINVRVGGFFKIPSPAELQRLCEQLKVAREQAIATVRWAATLDFPAYQRDYEFVALCHPSEYPFNEGRIVSNKGLNIGAAEFEAAFAEQQVAYSTALHSRLKERGAYFVGPMARYNLNYPRLSPLTRQIAEELALQPPVLNPFKSIIVRSLEVLYAFDEAIRILENWQPPAQPFQQPKLKAASGYAATEAPRGLLYHRYQVNAGGEIVAAQIVPPTSQNQKTIEQDLAEVVPAFQALSDDQLRQRCEHAIRNYDPCISCSTHFIKIIKE